MAACAPVAAPPPDAHQPCAFLATVDTVDSLVALVAAFRRAAPAAAAGTSRSSSASRLILNAGSSELDAAVIAFVQAAARNIPLFAGLLRSIAMGEKTFILLPHFVAPPVGKNDKVAAMALHQDTEKECTMLTVGFSLSGDALGIELFSGREECIAVANTPAFAFDASLLHRGVELSGRSVHSEAAVKIGRQYFLMDRAFVTIAVRRDAAPPSAVVGLPIVRP